MTPFTGGWEQVARNLAQVLLLEAEQADARGDTARAGDLRTAFARQCVAHGIALRV